MTSWIKTGRALELLVAQGVATEEGLSGALARFGEVVREWNARSGLMARGELRFLDEHVADSLSLAPHAVPQVAAGAVWVDVGSGGGFPAIPLALALGNPSLRLVERNQKKLGFLRMAVAKLGLTRTELRSGSFPACLGDLRPDLVTARAVEKPAVIIPAIGAALAAEGVYLCQRSRPLDGWAEVFHVEQIEDAFDVAGLRRGYLYRLRRR